MLVFHKFILETNVIINIKSGYNDNSIKTVLIILRVLIVLIVLI